MFKVPLLMFVGKTREFYEWINEKIFQRVFLFGKKFDVIIPLGADCGCAGCLNSYNLRYFSYPFDWLFKISFENRIKLIENHFDDFLVKENLVFLEKDPNAVLVDNENDYYRDVKYGTQFLHDFAHGVPLNVSYQTVKEKYDRRIYRLYNNIENAKNVLFVWRDKNVCLSNSDIENAYQRLCHVFSKQDIFFLVIENNNANDNTISKEILNSNIIKIKANIAKTLGTMPSDLVNGNKIVNHLIFRQIKCKKEPFSFKVWFWKKYIRLFCSLIRPKKKRKLIRAYLNSQLLSVKD